MKVDEPLDEQKFARAVLAIQQDIPVFASRYSRLVFRQLFSHVNLNEPVTRSAAYRFLTHDYSAPDSASRSAILQRLEFVLNSEFNPDLPCLIYDMRALNNHEAKSKFDAFWEALNVKLVQYQAAPEKRRLEKSFISEPIAPYTEQLIESIKQEAKLSDDQVPSSEWVRLSFTPKNSRAQTALQYTSRFDISFVIQYRDMREYASSYITVMLTSSLASLFVRVQRSSRQSMLSKYAIFDVQFRLALCIYR